MKFLLLVVAVVVCLTAGVAYGQVETTEVASVPSCECSLVAYPSPFPTTGPTSWADSSIAVGGDCSIVGPATINVRQENTGVIRFISTTYTPSQVNKPHGFSVSTDKLYTATIDSPIVGMVIYPWNQVNNGQDYRLGCIELTLADDPTTITLGDKSLCAGDGSKVAIDSTKRVLYFIGIQDRFSQLAISVCETKEIIIE